MITLLPLDRPSGGRVPVLLKGGLDLPLQLSLGKRMQIRTSPILSPFLLEIEGLPWFNSLGLGFVATLKNIQFDALETVATFNHKIEITILN